MAIQTSCPHCGTAYRVGDQQSGQKVICKKCRQVFTVGSAAKRAGPLPPEDITTEPSVLPVEPASRPRRRSAPDDGPAARRRGRREREATAFPWPWVIAGTLVGLFLLMAVGGVGAWLLFRGTALPDPGANPGAAEGALAAGADDHAARGLDELKAATAYVKVSAGPLRATGSGFLIKVDGNTGYVVTNDHVANPVDPDLRPGVAAGWGAPEITLVFRSGTKDERSFRAELVGDDAERDLAVLKVAGVADLPRPLDITAAPKLAETLPVTVFGFPFGDALAMHVGNPSITVSKGSVSSIRRDERGEVVRVQIDGALNPGNSGGPVVDADGHLVGVAVASIRGANIGLAIPGGELSRMLDGRVGAVRAVTRGVTDANAEVEVQVQVIDPLRRIQSVAVHYLRSDLVKDNPRPEGHGNWPELPGAQRLALRLDGSRAVGTFVVLAADKDRAFTFQASYVDSTGRQLHTEPHSLRPRAPARDVVGRPPVIRPPAGAPPAQPPVAKQPPPAPRRIKRPPPIAYQVHVPKTDKEQVPLSGPVADVVRGGGGRYLILRLAGKKKLAVFDVQLGKVVKELPVAEEPVQFAAGASRLVVIYPNAKLIQLWSLTTFERERSALLPGTLTSDSIRQVCMGSTSAGPLFAYLPREKRTLALNLDSLETTEVRWTHWAPSNAYGPLDMRASPDGTLLIGWGGGWAGCEVATFSDGLQTGSNPKIEFWSTDGVFALPSADGAFIYTPYGILNRAFNQAKVPELKSASVVPAVEPGYFLSLANTCNPGTPPPHAQADGTAAVYNEDRKQLFFLRGLDELKARVPLAWDKRIHYYPRAGLLLTLGGESDRLVLRRADLTEQLDKSGSDYLVVVSRPPLAKAGTAFSYRLDVRSKKGGAKVKLESGPAGLKVTPEGQVSWDVPAKLDEPEAEVIVTIRDASGQEVFHTFKIDMAPR
jgi:predicted Zn finger-like uncharacterized protein